MNTRGVAAEYRLTQWSQVMQERMAQGESITAFCENRGISKNTYFYWQRKIREAACEQLALTQSNANNRLPSFAEVKVSQSSAEQLGQIQIEYNGIQMIMDSSYPPDKLAVLIRELAKPC